MNTLLLSLHKKITYNCYAFSWITLIIAPSNFTNARLRWPLNWLVEIIGSALNIGTEVSVFAVLSAVQLVLCIAKYSPGLLVIWAFRAAVLLQGSYSLTGFPYRGCQGSYSLTTVSWCQRSYSMTDCSASSCQLVSSLLSAAVSQCHLYYPQLSVGVISVIKSCQSVSSVLGVVRTSAECLWLEQWQAE